MKMINEVSCSKTQHPTPSEIKTNDLAIKSPAILLQLQLSMILQLQIVLQLQLSDLLQLSMMLQFQLSIMLQLQFINVTTFKMSILLQLQLSILL